MTLEELLSQYSQGILDFIGVNLAEANLSNIDITGINFTQANLSVTNLSGCNLSKSNFTNAQMNVARLSNANLTDAVLNGASLNVANLIRADLTRAQLCAASLIRGELIRAELTRANLSDADLTAADCREATLRLANLRGANLSEANLRGCFLREANLEMANLHGTELSASDLSGANLKNAELRQANLCLVNLSGADLRGANLRWVDLSGANLRWADLSGAKLSGANLTGVDLTNANLTNASLVHANLTQAKLIKVEWNATDLSGATLTGAKLYNTPRFGLKTEGITCEWVDLSPAGDRSIIQNFTPEEAKEFFNATPPTLKIIIDAQLTHEANFVLAGTYYKIAQEYPDLIQPPNIEINNRRTILNFRIDSDITLFSIAFMAIFPFQDRSNTQKSIYTIIDLLRKEVIAQKDIHSTKIVRKLIINFAETMNRSKIIQTTKKNLEMPAKMRFFQAPTQTIISNSKGKTLTIYDHPNAGKRVMNTLNNDDNIASETSYKIPSPQKILEFVKGLYLLE